MRPLAFIRHLLLAAACLAASTGVPADVPTVLVVNGVAPIVADDYIGALREGLGARFNVEVVEFESRPVEYARAQVIVPLGSAAFEAVVAAAPEVPVAGALLPRAVFERVRRVPSVRASALFLGQPFARQLAVARKAFPRARRLGVLVGPDSAQALPALVQAAREAGLALIAERGDADRLHGALRAIVAGADMLLVLPDPMVFNASSIQGILLETYRARIPVIGISPAYTRAGAVLSLSVSPVQLGSETARLVREVVEGKMPAPRYSEAAEVHVNRQVARSLGLDLPSDDALLSAARSVP